MATHKVEITQVFTVERTITIEVEASSAQFATEKVLSGSIDTPSFDDPKWQSTWNLTDESAKGKGG